MAKRLCEFCTSSTLFLDSLHLYAWATYKRGDIPDAGEFDYINRRVLAKYPTAEFVQMQRRSIPKGYPTPPTEVRWEFQWVVWNDKEVNHAD